MKKTFIIILLCIFLLLPSCSKKGNTDNVINEPDSMSIIEEQSIYQSNIADNEENNLKQSIVFSENYNVDDIIIDISDKGEALNLVETLNDYEWFTSKTTLQNVITTESLESDITIEGIFASGFPVVNNTVKLEDIIHDCDGSVLRQALYDTQYAYMSYINTGSGIIQGGSNTMVSPIVMLRQIEPGKYYDIKHYRYGGYLYTFYDMQYDPIKGEYITNDPTDITQVGGVYVENVLSYNDFITIKKGTHIDELEKIDSAVAFYKLNAKIDEVTTALHMSDLHKLYCTEKMQTLHLLTDGLLTISYTKKGGEFYVSDIEFSPEFIYNPPYIAEEYGNQYPKLFKIMEQDYPPAN